ncbi:MAG: alanine--glyoxylate aminotransferase family protein [Bdellovibrionota bacterium]
MKVSSPMKKPYLLTPGPTVLPESVVTAFAQPILHHRSPEFEKLFAQVKEDIKYVFQTKKEVLILSCTGTGAMEAAVTNLFSVGDKVITVNAGKFGERWTKLSKAFGLKPVEILIERGHTLDVKKLEDVVAANKDAKAILFQAHETSTGVVLPTQEIAKIAQKAHMMSVCDAITATGAFDLPMDDWGVDVVISGSQKAMMIPPGLAFIALSDKAWAAAETSTIPHFYFDLKKERKAHAAHQTAWTPAVSLIQGLKEALRLIHEEGLENRFKRHNMLAKATRAGVKAMGLDLLSEVPSPSVTAVKIPESLVNGKKIPSIMREKYGVTIAGGQDELTGKIIRISHFGYIGEFDITTGLACLELTLNDLGHKVKFGSGVGAALEVFATEGLR